MSHDIVVRMRPKISLENKQHVQELYQHYEEYQQPRLTSQLAWRAFDGLCRPWVGYVDGAEEEINNLRLRKIPQIYAFNHPTDVYDQFVVAATLLKVDPSAAGRTRVLTKDPVIKMLGPVADILGGVPAFRKSDNGDGELVDFATATMLNTTANIILDNQNLVIFPEGTHTKGDPSVIGKVRTGIGEIATRVTAKGGAVAITPIGMSYGRIGTWPNPRHANVVVGHSFVVDPDATVHSITQDTANRLQKVVTTAHKHHQI